jgi:hypothetical protein
MSPGGGGGEVAELSLNPAVQIIAITHAGPALLSVRPTAASQQKLTAAVHTEAAEFRECTYMRVRIGNDSLQSF